MNSILQVVGRIFAKAMNTSMFNRWIVLVLDLCLCAIGYSAAVLINAAVYNKTTIPFPVGWGFVYLGFCSFSFYLFKSYRGLIRHSSIQELWRIFFSLLLSSLFLLLILLVSKTDFAFRGILILNTLSLSLILILVGRVLVVTVYNYTMSYNGKQHRNTLVYGISDHSLSLAQWINRSPRNAHTVQGFLVREDKALSTRVYDIPVYNLENDNLDYILRKLQITNILFPDYATAKREEDFVKEAIRRGIQVMVSPPLEGLGDQSKAHFSMRPIQFEDLLGREEIEIDLNRISSQVYNKTILITGAAGSIGSELVRQLAAFGPRVLVLYDMAETPLHNLRLELESNYPNLRFVAVVGDVRNMNRLTFVFDMFKPDLVYHAAAYKHVPMMEENPCEAILVNILGTKNLCDCAVKFQVERLVMVSTDKAVRPTNVMGATKRVAEIYVQCMAKIAREKGLDMQCVTTRFGNVLGSNGSVIPHFKAQIERGGPVTVTHPDIIRYFMTIPEACRLVLEAGSFGKNGEIYVFDMGEPVKIIDLANRMIEMAGLIPNLDINIEYTGLRPGEKLYEELLNAEETTLPTDHSKIKVAKVISYESSYVQSMIRDIIDNAKNMDLESAIIQMKELIPDYISQNSPWEKFDVHNAEATNG